MKIKIKETAKAKKNYSLYKLAQVLEIPQQTVYSWAKGRTQPSWENLDRICEALSCKIEDLLEAEPIQHKLNLKTK
ncbi:helix-turn-helix transcriptional regulator [bacterium]|nr:helix-turn-helix transcriptional regulator [bacterium]